jgi:hypothetical protein
LCKIFLQCNICNIFFLKQPAAALPGCRIGGGGGGDMTNGAGRSGRYSKGGSLDSRYGNRTGGGGSVVYPLPAGHYLPDLPAANHHHPYLGGGGGGGESLYGVIGGVGGGGDQFAGGGSPATWQDLIQPRLPHIIKGRNKKVYFYFILTPILTAWEFKKPFL